MQTLSKILMVVFLCGLWVGCSGGPEEVKVPTSSERPSFTPSSPAASSAAKAPAPAATPGFSQPRNRPRNLPAASVGGGGGGSMAAATPPGAGNNNAAASGTPAGTAANASSGPFTADTRENGLFPQVPGAGNATAGFGGALFPSGSTVASSAGSGSGSSSGGSLWSRLTGGLGRSANAEPKATVKPEGVGTGSMGQMFRKKAVKQFSDLAHDNDAVSNIYISVLSDPGAMRKYPMKWFQGINQPRVMFRWGIGIVYREPTGGLDGRHPVLGDSGGASGSGGGSGAFDGGNAGLEGGEGPPPPGAGGGGSSSERKYRNVNTARPDGVVLYYTGEMGEMVIDALDKRRRHNDAFYGELLQDIPIYEPSEPARQTAANTNPGGPGAGGGGAPRGFGQPRNRRRDLPGAAIGGGGGADQPAAPPGAGSPAGSPQGNPAGGNAETASKGPKEAPDEVLQRAMGSGDSAKPDPTMTGTVIPGVMLVGVGKKADLEERAKQMGLDALIVINVTVSKTRSSEKVSSMTKMTILNLHDSANEVVYNSKALKDTIVAEQKEKGMTPVKNVVDVAFKDNADKQFKAGDFPSVLADGNEKGKGHVKNRISKIVAEAGSNQLPVAVEILHWHQLGMVDTQFAIESLNQVFGSESVGTALVSGDTAGLSAMLGNLADQFGADDEDDDL
ncbi:MAG: hypothetical protein MK108_09975 [Mariniblastus sp.]|nr:hypothetical protein [Mariniblastus sp.]